jgi:alanyl-tRNA synthetase
VEKTIRLEQENPYLSQCDSMIVDCIKDDAKIRELGGSDLPGSLLLVLDRTLFFPEGGGQPSDRGRIELKDQAGRSYTVVYVLEADGVVYHQVHPLIVDSIPVDKRAHADADAIVGQPAICLLDWDFRFTNMQRHCGEHILSAVFFERWGGINRGFHMGDDFMTIDISLEDDLEDDDVPYSFTEEDMAVAEWEANRMIWQNLSVIRRFFQTKDEAASIPMRKALNVDADITLVGLGDLSYAAGTVACCGTHPGTTGEVGVLKIYKKESYKGMTRITFDAGAPALSRIRKESDLIRALCRRYSAEPDTLSDRLASSEDKKSELRQELYDLKQVTIRERADEILEALPPQGRQAETLLIREYKALKVDDLLSIGRLLPKDRLGLLALVDPASITVILFSGGLPDCGKIVKDNAQVWNGKGGGKSENARAMFPTRQDLDCFLDYLQKVHGRKEVQRDAVQLPQR